MDQLCERIRAAREGAGLTVNQAAEALGVKRVQIWRLEHKATTISAARLFELSKLYDIDPQKLFLGTTRPMMRDHYQARTGDIVELVETIIQTYNARPHPKLVRRAVLEILNQESRNLAKPFDPALYQGMIALIFEETV